MGAQAVYEYVRDQAGDFGVPPFTLDADLALIPELLVDDPKVIDAMGRRLRGRRPAGHIQEG